VCDFTPKCVIKFESGIKQGKQIPNKAKEEEEEANRRRIRLTANDVIKSIRQNIQ